VKQDVQDWLTNWFASRAKIKIQMKTGEQSCPSLDADYFAAGWLTSMEVVEFITEIEQQFAMQFSDRDLQDPRFVTITGLAELILERSTQTSQSR
jgi:acyl carrier protein